MAWGAVKIIGINWISTGICRVNFQRPNGLVMQPTYDIFCQPSVRGQSCIVMGRYSTYFTVEVRNSAGNLQNIEFSFQMVGNNYPD